MCKVLLRSMRAGTFTKLANVFFRSKLSTLGSPAKIEFSNTKNRVCVNCQFMFVTRTMGSASKIGYLRAQLNEALKFTSNTRKHFLDGASDETLARLEEENVNILEILEDPFVLHIPLDQLEKRIAVLKHRKVPTTLRALRYVCLPTKKKRACLMREKLSRYHQRMKGHRSLGQYLVKHVGLQKDLVFAHLATHPHKISSEPFADVLHKYGCEADCYLSVVLATRSRQEIEKRCKELTSFGIRPPPLYFLILTKMKYQLFFRAFSQHDSLPVESQTEETITSAQNDLELSQLENTLAEKNKPTLDNLKLFQEIKCEWDEIIEWPQVLEIDKDELFKRVRFLAKKGFPVSVGCLKRAGMENKVVSLQRYLKMNKGHKSMGECLIQQCGLSKKLANQFVQFVVEHNMVFGTVLKKLEIIRRYVLNPEDFLRYPHLFWWNVPELEHRCSRLSAHNIDMLEYAKYHNHKKSYMHFDEWIRCQVQQLPVVEKVASVLNVPPQRVISALWSSSSRLKGKRKMRITLSEAAVQTAAFLAEERNYSSDAILENIDILQLTEDQLRDCLYELEDAQPEKHFSLNDVIWCFTGLTEFHRLAVTFAVHILKPSLNGPLVSSRTAVTNVTQTDMALNYIFLTKECKFSREDLKTLPLLILHNPAAVRESWEQLTTRLLPENVEELRKTPERLIHLLQYYLEQRTGFRHLLVLKNRLG